MRTVLSTIGRLAVLLPFAALPMFPGQAEAWPPGPTKRSNHVPNVGFLADREQPLGDMWTFYCPPGGHVVAFVDTKDDTDLAISSLDPVLQLLDGNGNLIAAGNDDRQCTYQPICGFACPEIRHACGDTWDVHSLIVRDFGSAALTTLPLCNDGGGYELTVDVYDEWGNQLSPDQVALGGGAGRSVPGWAVDEGKAPYGPALDDENVPLRSNNENHLPQSAVKGSLP